MKEKNEQLKTVQEEWMGITTEVANQEQVVIREYSCMPD